MNSQKNTVENLPEKKFKAGAISATVWLNKGQGKQGDEMIYKTISVERNYKDKEGNWQTTSSFRINDLPKLAVVSMEAYKYLVYREQE